MTHTGEKNGKEENNKFGGWKRENSSNWLRGPKKADPNRDVKKAEKQPKLYHRTPKRLKKSYA